MWFRRLAENRWLYTFSASATATIVGITLTFGINSWRETSRKKAEAEESVMEAVTNISIRAEQVGKWCELLEQQNEIYLKADSINEAGGVIPDSLCVVFKATLPQIQTSLSDHGFEKVFRESYQLWQALDQNKLTSLINGCFEILNYTESLSRDLLESMIVQIEDCNAQTPLVGTDARFFTEAMLRRPQFRFYMTLRVAKVEMLRANCITLEKFYKRIEMICSDLGYRKKLDDSVETFHIDDDRIETSAEY